MTDIFEAPKTTVDTNEQISSYRGLFVGEGKKFQSDEDLAKGKYEADQFIERLKQEAADLRKELGTRISLEEFMTKNLEKPSNQTPTSVVEQQTPNEIKTVADYERIATDVYTKQQLNAQRVRNADISSQKLKEAWGDSYVQHLEKVSRDLGLGKDFLQDLAERSPDAFLQVVGAGTQSRRVENITPPASRVNSAANLNPKGGVRDEAFWDKIKQTDPKMYFSAEGYNRRHQDAQALGPSYFKS